MLVGSDDESKSLRVWPLQVRIFARFIFVIEIICC